MTTTLKFEPDLVVYEQSLSQAADACISFANKLAAYEPPKPKRQNPFIAALDDPRPQGAWLTLSGRNGCGKTMLARQLFNYAARIDPFGGSIWKQTDSNTSRRPKVVWLDEVTFIGRCKDGEYDLPEYLGEDWLVVIDDLGASRDKTNFAGEMLFRLCNARAEKFMIFTTNLERKQIAETVDPRIASRMVRDNNRAITITAGDYGVRQTIARKSA